MEVASNFLNKYTTIMSVIHFIGPFIINIISSFGIIAIIANNRSKTENK
jgi:preprotein translocase subunit SecG